MFGDNLANVLESCLQQSSPDAKQACVKGGQGCAFVTDWSRQQTSLYWYIKRVQYNSFRAVCRASRVRSEVIYGTTPSGKALNTQDARSHWRSGIR